MEPLNKPCYCEEAMRFFQFGLGFGSVILSTLPNHGPDDDDKYKPSTSPITKPEKIQSQLQQTVTTINRATLPRRLWPVPPVDELIEQLNFNNQKKPPKKVLLKKKRVKEAPQPRSKPRILRTNISRSNTLATTEDELSINSNKYNKRFTKTKKPARL